MTDRALRQLLDQQLEEDYEDSLEQAVERAARVAPVRHPQYCPTRENREEMDRAEAIRRQLTR